MATAQATPLESDTDRYDVDLLVIGAGPHALSLLARLVDDEPDLRDERTRAAHATKAGSRGRSHTAVRQHLRKSFDACSRLPQRTLVLDTHGSFMAQWKQDFAALEIHHTRSHADLHPCPFDFTSLRAWAAVCKREHEMWHMHHLDRDACRREGYRGPFQLVGSALFADFCDSLVERYNLAPLVQRGTVSEVRALRARQEGEPCTFVVRLASGEALSARRVVCALGPGPLFSGMRATLPWWAEDLAAELKTAGALERLLHSQELIPRLLNDETLPPAGARILIVGGGQTAGHLALLARRRGARVCIAARRRISVKPYDVDLELTGDKRADVLRRFWALAEPARRIEFIRALRGGGSMSPEVYENLRAARGCQGNDDGGDDRDDEASIDILEEAEVETARWCSAPGAGGGCGVEIRFDNGRRAQFDHVWLATGGALDLSLVPIFASLFEQRPIDVHDGLPRLQPDLSWDAGCPLYVMGAFAQLELGPDALNLAGARSGSVLVARALLEALVS